MGKNSLTLLLTLLLAGSPMAAAYLNEGPIRSPVYLPGGVADQNGKTGYVGNVTDGIDAIDLETGRTLWQSALASKPLVAFDHSLVALALDNGKANSVHMVVLDEQANGKLILESDPIVFPAWVVVGGALGRTFSSEGRINKGNFMLAWGATTFYCGGAAPPPQVLKAAARHAVGVARINLQSGHVEMLDAKKTDADSGMALPNAPNNIVSAQYVRLGNIGTNKTETGVDSTMTYCSLPLVVGNTLAAFSLDKQDGHRLVLNTWDLSTHEPRDPIELMKSKNNLRLSVTRDGRYVFVTVERLKQPSDYVYVFSTETGKRLAKLPFEQVRGADFTVLGSRMFVLRRESRAGLDGLQAQSLRAIDLASAETVWEHPLKGLSTFPNIFP